MLVLGAGRRCWCWVPGAGAGAVTHKTASTAPVMAEFVMILNSQEQSGMARKGEDNLT